MAGLVELRDTLEPKNQPFSQDKATVKEAQQFVEKQVSKAKQLGEELFGQEPPHLLEVSFEELKTSWNTAEPSLDIFIQFLRSIDPNTPLSRLASDEIITANSKKAVEQIQNFSKLLKAAIDNNTASDILFSRYYGGDEQSRIEIRSRRIEETIRKLQQNYGND